jgi:nucleoside 2-deoxyribosyltransferase
MGSKIKIYLASPLGFSEAGRYFYDGRLIPAIQWIGYEVLDPWKLTDLDKIQKIERMLYGEERRDAWKKLNMEIAENNRGAIDRSDGLVAVLDGTDVDSGTAAEIGYGFAKGKPILGYRGDKRLSADNEGAAVNLQVEYFILASGGTIVTEIERLQEELKRIFG